MLKHLLRMSGLFLLLACVSSVSQAQNFPKADKSPADIAIYRVDGQPHLKVIYGRPAKKGRAIFGELVPFGEVWRTGANEATEIRLYADANIGEETLEAGIYSLFTIPGEDSWTIIFSNQTDVWGAYQYNAEMDQLRIEVPASNGEEALENFSVAFKEVDSAVHLVLGWDETRVEIPFVF